MRWFRGRAAAATTGRHRASAVAAPPAPAVGEQAPAVTTVVVEVAESRPGVVLGFRDGSTLALTADAPGGGSAAPFAELADVLLEGLSRTGQGGAGVGR